MDEFEEILERLARTPVHAALAAGETELLARVHARAPTSLWLSGRVIALTAAVAAFMGVASAAIPSINPEAHPPSSPFSATNALAPSTLLGSDL